MSYIVFFSCFAVILIMTTTRKSGYSIAFAILFSAIAAMMVCGILYKITFSNYEIIFEIELPFYKHFRKINVSYYDLKKLVVVSMMIFFFGLNMISVSSKFEYYGTKNKILYSFVIFALMVIFAVLNSSNLSEQVFLWNYSGGFKTELAQILTHAVRVFDCALLFGFYIIPVKDLIRDYRNTGLLLYKKQLVMMLVCLALIGVIATFAIFEMPIFHILYSLNIYDFYNFSFAGGAFNTHLVVAIIIVMIVINILLIRYRVFDVYNIFRRKSVKEANIAILDLRHIFHTIKNYAMIIIALHRKALKEVNQCGGTDNLEKIGATAVELINQCGNFLDLCTDVNLTVDKVNLLECVNEAAAHLSCEDIDVSICVDTEKIHIYGNKSIITEMCINIIQNAVDAIRTAEKESGKVIIRIFSEHKVVCISFWDNGCGLKRTNIKNVLKPFVSSKKTFDHWGIGLSYVSNAVRLHSGYIDIRSKSGEFTEIQTAFNLGAWEGK